ncbi:leucine-rich repeat protein [Butyrivibrio sp. MB2005]|uniref:leucine-rich repeat protein n=1 Tax=Butyrivibrio sp. MB2005 TaxID=1280678 RepID=UPI00041D1DF2|nr:leucine-rich repeat protein [Butyrivibrio sp. MB2005]
MRKGIIMALACAAFVCAMPLSAKAETPIQGGRDQAHAESMTNLQEYFEEDVNETRDYYYKFKTDGQEGIHLLSFESMVNSKSTYSQITVQIMDNYGNVIDGTATGGAGTQCRTEATGNTVDIVLPLSGLAKNEWYYIRVNTNDGDSSKKFSIKNMLQVKFIAFRAADNFNMKAGNGTFKFTWDNIQHANKYNSLRSFDGFQLGLFSSSGSRVKYIGNGGAKEYSLSASDADLVALGYPAKEVTMKLGCLQEYHSEFNYNFKVTKCVYTGAFKTEVVKKAAKSDVSGLKYKITNVKGDGTGTVTVLGFANKNKATKKVTIGSNVKINGTSYKVTAISNKAFAGNKTVTSVEIGANVTSIGSNAFDNCPNLKTVTIKATNLKKVGSGAFKRVNKKVKFKSPNKTLNKKYKKLLKKKTVSGAKYSVG